MVHDPKSEVAQERSRWRSDDFVNMDVQFSRGTSTWSSTWCIAIVLSVSRRRHICLREHSTCSFKKFTDLPRSLLTLRLPRSVAAEFRRNQRIPHSFLEEYWTHLGRLVGDAVPVAKIGGTEELPLPEMAAKALDNKRQLHSRTCNLVGVPMVSSLLMGHDDQSPNETPSHTPHKYPKSEPHKDPPKSKIAGPKSSSSKSSEIQSVFLRILSG